MTLQLQLSFISKISEAIYHPTKAGMETGLDTPI